ncbi:MAG: 3-phosphoshikimate 1-carboxyvinyltransferase [Woeseia sp.]
MHFHVEPSVLGGGTLRVPGDKSISHRALLLGAIARGESSIRGFLPGADCLATLAALRDLGVEIRHDVNDQVTIRGNGLQGLELAAHALDLGNSGTAMRLFTGLLAAQPFDSTLTGDASLSARPMARVIDPLKRMGAEVDSNGGLPPLIVRGGRALHGIDYALPVASAQVKSAILLAGLYADSETVVREPAVTRDHTERMLQSMGARIDSADGVIRLQPGTELAACDLEVPADLSSATFPMLAALIADDCTLTLTNVGINPTRDGVLAILRAMGAGIELRNRRMQGMEPVADLVVTSSRLRGTDVDPALVPLAIDEFPALFIAAAYAEGITRFSGLAELRVKESDRLSAMVQGLQSLGVEVDEEPDGARIRGGALSGGEVQSFGDHRIAMSFAVAATRAASTVRIADVAAVDTSFPGFVEALNGLGAAIDWVEDSA